MGSLFDILKEHFGLDFAANLCHLWDPLWPDLVPLALTLIHLDLIWIAFRYILAYFDALPISNIQC